MSVDVQAEQVIARVRAARSALAEAMASPGSPGLRHALDELEEALRVAGLSGVEVPPAGPPGEDAGQGGR